jgi:2-oxoglutarate ferredoxin oxidoreductase subunit alpha
LVSKVKDISATRFELLMDAGNGAQKAGDILIKTFAKSGKFVYIEPLIPAEISPPKRTPYSLSGAVIRVSSEPVLSIGSETDLMLAEHEILLNRRLDDNDYAPGSVVFLDMGEKKRAPDAYADVIKRCESYGLTVFSFEMNDDALTIIKQLHGNGKNMFYLGMLSAIYSVSIESVQSSVKDTFKKLSPEKLVLNLDILRHGFDLAMSLVSERLRIPTHHVQSESILLDGNMALSMGIIDAGFKLYSGYPITPASTIMHHLAKRFPSYGGMLHQAEDEISAIGTAIGSYYAGVPALTGTSGPGLSLKQEFIGLAYAAEIPVVVIDVQRGGPSTGLPTRTEQTDLFAAIFGSHGDSPKVVISVATVEDCFYAPHIARYIAEKLRMPVFILSDYSTSVSYTVLPKLGLEQLSDISDVSTELLSRFFMTPLPDDIEMVKSNQADPGTPEKMRRVTGLNTNHDGVVLYSSESNHRGHSVRNEKIHHVKRALHLPPMIGEESGDVLILGWGSSWGVISEAVALLKSSGIKVSGLHFKIVYPLPLNLTDLFSRFKHVVTVEMAYADSLKPTPFATLLRSETLVNVTNLIANATGRPLKPLDIVDAVTQLHSNVNVLDGDSPSMNSEL